MLDFKDSYNKSKIEPKNNNRIGKNTNQNLASQTSFQQSTTVTWGRIFSTKQVSGENREGISSICFDRIGPKQLTKAQNNRTIPTFLPSRKIKCLQGLVVGKGTEVDLSVWLYDSSKYLHQSNSSDNCEAEKKHVWSKWNYQTWNMSLGKSRATLMIWVKSFRLQR